MQIKQGLDKVNITRQGYRVKPLVVRAQRARATSKYNWPFIVRFGFHKYFHLICNNASLKEQQLKLGLYFDQCGCVADDIAQTNAFSTPLLTNDDILSCHFHSAQEE